MEWRQYFPKAKLSHHPSSNEEEYSLQLEDAYLQISKNDLTEREQFLLSVLSSQVEEESFLQTTWEDYLLGEGETIPVAAKTYQFFYLEHSESLTTDLKEFLEGLLVGGCTWIGITKHRTAILLPEKIDFELSSLFGEVLVAIESDFGLALKGFIGNRWSQLDDFQLKQIFNAENNLFTSFLSGHHTEKMQSFSKLMLWGMGKQFDNSVLKEQVASYLQLQHEITTIVIALWESQGNQVQAANALFMHRNSLQYKMDKFQRLSGLMLKKLDDLALAYLMLLEK